MLNEKSFQSQQKSVEELKTIHRKLIRKVLIIVIIMSCPVRVKKKNIKKNKTQ